MKTNALGFIGGGRITKIILQAFANRHRDFQSIIVFDKDLEISEALKSSFPNIKIAKTIEETAKQPIIFIALPTSTIVSILDKITNYIDSESIIISLAPQLSIENLSSHLKTVKIARMMPCATTIINKGYNPIAFGSAFSSYEKVDLLGIFMHLGNTFEVEETKLEAYALLSSMLPSYFWVQWNKLVQLGSQMGLTPHESSDAISKTLEAANELLFSSELQPTEVMDLISSKPLAECETTINDCYEKKLMDLFEDIKPE